MGAKIGGFGVQRPLNVNFNNSNPQKARVSTEPRLKMYNVLLARVMSGLWDGLEKKADESHNSLANQPLVGAPLLGRPPKLLLRFVAPHEVVIYFKFG